MNEAILKLVQPIKTFTLQKKQIFLLVENAFVLGLDLFVKKQH
jgi:hypothetical protein